MQLLPGETSTVWYGLQEWSNTITTCTLQASPIPKIGDLSLSAHIMLCTLCRYWRTVYLVQLAAWMSYWIDNHVERGAGYRYAASTRRDVNGLVWATGMV